jgi:hypothetical protein
MSAVLRGDRRTGYGETRSPHQSAQRRFIGSRGACGTALVLLHHTNRKGEEYTGSIHLGAIVDGPLTLKKSQGRQLDTDADAGDVEGEDAGETKGEGTFGDGRRLLVGQTRWGAVRIVLEFNHEDGRCVMYTMPEYVTARITEELASTPVAPAVPLALREARRRWADLLRVIYEVDPLVCGRCGGAMRVVALVTARETIDELLAHIRARSPPGRGPGASSPLRSRSTTPTAAPAA